MFLKTSEQKWAFLGALYKYGTNIDGLKKALPTWNVIDIKQAVRRYRLRAARHLQASRDKSSKEDFINTWGQFLENCQIIEGTSHKTRFKRKDGMVQLGRRAKKIVTNDHSFLLSKAMKYAAHFENHYQGPSSSDPHYAEIYSYLSDLLSGEEPKQLRPGSAAKVLEMMDAIKYIISNKDSTSRYSNYIAEHVASNLTFLNAGVNPAKVAKIKKDEAIRVFENEDDAEEPCPLFNEDDAQSLQGLDKLDPNYIVVRDAHIEKFSERQKHLAKRVLAIPGLNPLEVSLDAVLKPPVALLMAMDKTTNTH